MKNKNAFITVLIIFMTVLMGQTAKGAEAPYLAPLQNQTAMVGEFFTMDVNAVFADPPETYELTTSPPGMVINPVTGVIEWTPASVENGGLVTVRAYNSEGESVRSFLIYVAEALPCESSVVSYWKLDETGGSIFYDYVGTNHAQSQSMVYDTAGVVNNGQVLNPMNNATEYLKVAHTPEHSWNRTDDFTWSLWFKHSGGGVFGADVQVLMAKGGINQNESLVTLVLDKQGAYPRVGFQMKTDGGNDTIFTVYNPTQISANQWYNVVGVYRGSSWPSNTSMDLYVNTNKTSNSFGMPAGNFSKITSLDIGYWSYFNSKFPFSGVLDEILIFDKALSDAEVNALNVEGITNRPHCPRADNYAPVFSSAPVTTAQENVPYTYMVTTSDYEGQGLDRSAVILPSWLSFNEITGMLSGTPGSTNVGDTLVRLQVTDGNSTVYQAFNLNVENVNNAPEIISTPSPLSINEDEEYTYTVEIVDGDPGDVVTLTAIELPDWMDFNASTGVLSGTPSNDQVQYSADSSFNVIIEAKDMSDLTDTQEFTLTVINVNDAPIVVSQNSISTNRNTPVTISLDDLVVEDVDDRYPDNHSLNILAGDNYTFNGLELTPVPGFFGDLIVNVEVSDGEATVSYELAVTVEFVNTAPEVASIPDTTVKVNELYTYRVVAVDAEGDDITYTGTYIPDWMSFDADNQLLIGTASMDQLGDHTVIITISDGFKDVFHQFKVTVTQFGTAVEAHYTLINGVYPTPADQYVIFDLNTDRKLKIELTNLSGKIVVSDHIEGLGQHTIDVSTLNPGIYMFSIIDEEYRETGKLIIE